MTGMTEAIDDFVTDARSVPIREAALLLGLKFTRGLAGIEHPQPCPVRDGRDCFSFNTRKNGGVGGREPIGVAAHVRQLDLKRRDGFLTAARR
jgi:hypothetical protein